MGGDSGGQLGGEIEGELGEGPIGGPRDGCWWSNALGGRRRTVVCGLGPQPLRLPTVAANGPVRPHRQKHPQAEHNFVSVMPQYKKFKSLKNISGQKKVQGPERPHRQKHSQAESSFSKAVLQKVYGAKKTFGAK